MKGKRQKAKGKSGKWGPTIDLILLTFAFCLLPFPLSSHAQEGPAQWLARIFDPASLGITVPQNAALNKKLSVDAIVLERGGTKRIAIYTIPPDQLKPAAEHFTKSFGGSPQVTGADSPYETYTFDFTGDGTAAPKLHGLRVLVSRSQFVDNKGQITMEYSPPEKAQ
jgi:hypothetical protein